MDYVQNVVLPACDREYRNVYGVQTMVRVMDLREILAEKLRAASGRARYRDFYDIAIILDTHQIRSVHATLDRTQSGRETEHRTRGRRIGNLGM
jgi:predicted nucleotidyltransferase component of viral defense system